MVVLLQGSPTSTEELWSSVRVTIEFLVTSVPNALLRWLSLAMRPFLGRVLVVPNLFYLRMMATTVFLGTINGAEVFGTLPQICALTQSCLRAQRTIPLTSFLGFYSDMHCQLWDLL